MAEIRLEGELPSDIEPSRKQLRGHHAEVPSIDVVLNILVVRAIEQVKEVNPELENEPLGNVIVLVNAKIGFRKGWVAEQIILLVAVGAHGRHGELPWRENAGGVILALGVTRDVGEIASVIGEAGVHPLPIREIVAGWVNVRVCTCHVVSLVE